MAKTRAWFIYNKNGSFCGEIHRSRLTETDFRDWVAAFLAVPKHKVNEENGYYGFYCEEVC